MSENNFCLKHQLSYLSILLNLTLSISLWSKGILDFKVKINLLFNVTMAEWISRWSNFMETINSNFMNCNNIVMSHRTFTSLGLAAHVSMWWMFVWTHSQRQKLKCNSSQYDFLPGATNITRRTKYWLHFCTSLCTECIYIYLKFCFLNC